MMNISVQNFFISYIFKITLLLFIIFSECSVNAQQNKIDSIKLLILNTKSDTAKIALFDLLSFVYRDYHKMDSGTWARKQALSLNEKTHYSPLLECYENGGIAYLLYETGNCAESLKYAMRQLALSENIHDTMQQGLAHLNFGHDYKELGYFREALDHYFKGRKIIKTYWEGRTLPEDNRYTFLCIAQVYLKMSKPDSAMVYAEQAYKSAITTSDGPIVLLAERIFGDIYLAKNNDERALKYYKQYLPDFIKYKELNRDLGFVLLNIGKIYKNRNQIDSAIFYTKKALANAQGYNDLQNIYDAATTLYELYKPISSSKDSSKNFNNKTSIKLSKVGRLKIDSLKKELSFAQTDSAKLEIMRVIAQQFVDIAELDSAIQMYQQTLQFVQKNKFPVKYEIWQLTSIAYFTSVTGNYSMSIQCATKAIQLSEQIKDNVQIAFSYSDIAAAHAGMGEYGLALNYYFKAKKAFETYESGHWAIQNIAETYLKMHMLDSALFYNQKAYYIADTGHNQQYMKDFAIRVFANIYAEQGNDQLALKYYRQFISDFYNYNLNNREIDRVYLGMANLYQKKNQIDSSIFYGEKALATAQIYNDQEHILNTSKLLYNLHDSLHNESQAFVYYKIATAAKDSMASIEKIRQIQNLTFNEQIREKAKQEEDAKEAARIRLIIIIAAILISIISFLIWNRIRQLKVRHTMILEQKEGEKLKVKYEKELLRMEAKALRAQMNPHFIFNCLNSIKSLIQQNENEKSVTYLTTFSKLIRTLLNNADKKEISLYDEIETCKYYLQLEAMRFDTKFSYVVNVDNNIDLKSILVPALIIQPFIENSIWHGIVPRNNGGKVSLNVAKKNEMIEVIIDDNGIGRESSQQNKSTSELSHQSKGVNLTQSRLELNNLLQQRQAKLEIIDNKDEKGIATGTTVIIKIKEEA